MPEGTTPTYAQRIARTLLAASVGIALLGVGARRPAPEEGVPMPSVTRPIRFDATPGVPAVLSTGSAALSGRETGDAMAWLWEEDGQPAGACWLARVGRAPPSCVCSFATIETLLTPDYMRALLKARRDGGSLSTRELHGRLQEVDATCGGREATP